MPNPVLTEAIPLIAWKVGRWGFSEWHLPMPGDASAGLLRCGLTVPTGEQVKVSHAVATTEAWPGVCQNCKVAVLRALNCLL